jgi:hypothetical protein
MNSRVVSFRRRMRDIGPETGCSSRIVLCDCGQSPAVQQEGEGWAMIRFVRGLYEPARGRAVGAVPAYAEEA